MDLGKAFWQIFEMWPYWLLLVVFATGVLLFEKWHRRHVLKIRDGGYSLEEALVEGECETIEFKSEISDSVGKTIGAFANGHGGTLFIGVNDDGRINGLPIHGDRTRDFYLSQIGNITRQKIDPPVRPVCTFLESESKAVLKIWVPPTGDPLHFVDGAVYLRHLSASYRASAGEIFKIFRNHFTRDRD